MTREGNCKTMCTKRTTTVMAGRLLRRGRRIGRRRGATILETAIILPIFLLLVLGMLDLGIAVFQHHALCQAARQGARRAVVHGELASRLGSWGPPGQASSTQGMADVDFHEIASVIRPFLTGFDPSSVSVAADWIDGNNRLGSRVQVSVTVDRPFLIPRMLGFESITLEGKSTMQIAH
jgi:Flp pilus assembly protein TadG